jgi:hypothetical protein
MFIYGLYAIEAHSQQQNQLSATESRKNFSRQKSYSISDGCALKNLKIRNSLMMSSLLSNSNGENLSKYELNLYKFEFYLERIKKLEEQKRLEDFLLNSNPSDRKSVVKTAQRRNTCSTVLSARHKYEKSANYAATKKLAIHLNDNSHLKLSTTQPSLHSTNSNYLACDNPGHHKLKIKIDTKTNSNNNNNNNNSSCVLSVDSKCKPLSKKWISNIIGRCKRSCSAAN